MLRNIAEREVIDYVDSPWYDWMDKKKYRPQSSRNVSYAKIKVGLIICTVFIVIIFFFFLQ